MDVATVHAGSPAAALAATSVSGDQKAANRQVIEAVHTVNAVKLFGQDSELTFTLDRGTHRPVIRIVDRKTKEVLRQIPADYVLRLAEAQARQAGE